MGMTRLHRSQRRIPEDQEEIHRECRSQREHRSQRNRREEVLNTTLAGMTGIMGMTDLKKMMK